MTASTSHPSMGTQKQAERDNGSPERRDIIQEIDKDTIRFISAGEKINDIETVLRELVENSIDAGAKNIEVRLAKFGVDSIEVDDNGSGISEENFSTLAVRYHTSKISSFANLEHSLETFGFRGEALSCLCSISNLSITTKTAAAPAGSKLTFEKDGSLARVDPVARDVGTTVMVKNLFHCLPVRRRELETTAKRQYDRVMRLIYEHVLARPHIKFSLCKKTNAKKERDFTHGGSTLEGCIITIFGIKVLDSLMSINRGNKLDTGSRDSSADSKTKRGAPVAENRTTRHQVAQNPELSDKILAGLDDLTEENKLAVLIEDRPSIVATRGDFFSRRSCNSKFARERPEYSIHGYISKVHCGRNSSDCQFTFVNQKPCDIPKISRLINETYKNYSGGQFPFACLFIQVQNFAADFNVPRKRTPMLQDLDKLCSLVRETLEAMFAPSAPGHQKSCSIALIPLTTTKMSNNFTNKSESGVDIKMTDDSNTSQDDHLKNNTQNNGTSLQMQVNTVKLIEDAEIVSKEKAKSIVEEIVLGPDETQPRDQAKSEFFMEKTTEQSVPQDQQELTVPINLTRTKTNLDTTHDDQPAKRARNDDGVESINRIVGSNDSTPPMDKIEPELNSKALEPKQEPIVDFSSCRFMQNEVREGLETMKVGLEYVEDLAMALARERHQRLIPRNLAEFKFSIHPSFNQVAEQELKLNLTKSSFENMQVLGQFNRGFIITRLQKHLFIIDQHATDERANYEEQLEKSPLEKQLMVRPKPLYLTLSQENVIIDNLKIFKDRGFEFKIDAEKAPGLRVLLTATSICKGHGLDEYLSKEDVEELIDVIIESPNRLNCYVLNKIKGVAATRACRKSVMIGDKLSWSQMKDIVAKMSILQNPWVCAHNRPTIRHLMDVDWMCDNNE